MYSCTLVWVRLLNHHYEEDNNFDVDFDDNDDCKEDIKEVYLLLLRSGEGSC